MATIVVLGSGNGVVVVVVDIETSLVTPRVLFLDSCKATGAWSTSGRSNPPAVV